MAQSQLFGLRPRPATPAVRPFDLAPRLKSMLDQAGVALAQPFSGCSTGPVAPGLFTCARTGISLAPLLEAARAFLAKLTAQERKAVCFAIDDAAWRKWSNIHPWLMRHG